MSDAPVKDLVFVHGFPFDGTIWRPQIVALRGRFRMHAPSLPGFGGTPLGAARTMDDYADQVVAEMDRVAMRQAALCGFSMGGYVLFALWRRHRERVGALVLADTRAEADSPEAAERRTKVAQDARQGGGAWMAEHLPPMLSSEAPAALHERLKEIVRAQPGEAIARASLAMAARPDCRPLLATIDVPALVIHGERDAIMPLADAQAMADGIPGARFVTIPGAGHAANVEAPEAFSQAVAGFLR